MEYYDQEYLNLFNFVNQRQESQHIMENEQLRGNSIDNNLYTQLGRNYDINAYTRINETPSYDNNQWGNVNEIQRNNYTKDYNINEFNIETRINGENINEVRRQGKEDRLNEVMENLRQERLNEIMRVEKEKEAQNLNEKISFDSTDIITVEMFERARTNSMLMLNNKMYEKGWMK